MTSTGFPTMKLPLCLYTCPTATDNNSVIRQITTRNSTRCQWFIARGNSSWHGPTPISHSTVTGSPSAATGWSASNSIFLFSHFSIRLPNYF